MNLQDFITKYTNQSGVGDTPENTGQCVGLIEVYTDSLGLSHTWGNADQLMANADPKVFDIIQNTPTGVPQPGDIVCWSGDFNAGVGHTGIFVSGDANLFECFEQNDPIGSTPHIRQYNYSFVQGWLHPHAPTDTTYKGIDLTNIDSVKVCIDTWSDVVNGQYIPVAQHNIALKLIADQDTKIKTLTDELTACQSKEVAPIPNIPIPVTTSQGTSTIVNVAVTTPQVPITQGIQDAPTPQPKPTPFDSFKQWLKNKIAYILMLKNEPNS